MTMRKPKRKSAEPTLQGAPGRRMHKLMRKHQDAREPRHAAPMVPQGRYSRFRYIGIPPIPYQMTRW